MNWVKRELTRRSSPRMVTRNCSVLTIRHLTKESTITFLFSLVSTRSGCKSRVRIRLSNFLTDSINGIFKCRPGEYSERTTDPSRSLIAFSFSLTVKKIDDSKNKMSRPRINQADAGSRLSNCIIGYLAHGYAINRVLCRRISMVTLCLSTEGPKAKTMYLAGFCYYHCLLRSTYPAAGT